MIKNKIIDEIQKRKCGISLEKFIDICLFDNEGYYETSNPLGRSGDFITSPEISQLFGEILGLYIHSLWHDKYKEKFIIGTGLNSLSDTINLMKISKTLNFDKFLIMPPAYYKYGDEDVINFYTRIINEIGECNIILYNFEKLSGYKFSIDCVEKLADKFPKQIVGVKDSSYNLYENLKINNFSVMPGSESKLLKGLELGCSGIITATTNVTSALAREVYDNFFNKSSQDLNKKLCNVRSAFEKYNLISGLHSFMSEKNEIYKNVLPPLDILSETDKKELFSNLKKLDFNIQNLKAAQYEFSKFS